MGSIVRVTNVSIKNLKNIRHGAFHTNSVAENLESSDVIGFYGQNGSGKTAAVEAFALLKVLLDSKHKQLPRLSEHLHYFNEENLELFFEFIVKNIYGEFYVQYNVVLGKSGKRLYVVEEKLSYKENEKGKRYKVIVGKSDNEISVRNQKLDKMSEKEKITTLVANKLSGERNRSFIFQDELATVYDNYLNNQEKTIIKNLKYDFERDFHVIKTTNYGLLFANLIMPFSIYLEGARGEIPYEMRDTMLVPKQLFKGLEEVINQINIVLNKIIPNLYIEVDVLHEQLLDNGEEGVRFELLSKKGDVILPLRAESSGTLKIISILSTLIAVYNNSNACVVIDELDAGIFEYLLGEIIEVLHENGKGQLIFTSHNLRILEVLPINNLWFSTANEHNRFIQLKGVKQSNNIRDTYIRSIQLGGQDETIYTETNSFKMKRFFRKAGKIDG